MSFARRPFSAAAVSPLLVGILVAVAATRPQAQQQQVVPGSNVNMVSGTTFPDGDPYLQRQNEPSSAVSTRNPSHILGGSNDYRTVDLPGPLDPIRGEKMNADAWAGLYKSFDGGQTWKSNLLPGYPQDTSADGRSSPIYGHHAATDAVVRAGTNGMFYYAGLAFNRGDNAPSTIFVARYMDLNNLEAGDPMAYLDTRVVDRDTGARFLDKTALATDVPRTSARCTFVVNVPDSDPQTQDIPAGNVYVAYTAFTGSGANLQSQIMFSRSTDCGAAWSPAISLSIGSRLVQNAQIAISPSNGHVYVSWRRFRSGTQDDAIMVVKSTNGGVTFGKPVRVAGIRPFDQGTTETSFRSNGFQTMAVDGSGRAYIAWTERGYATLRPDPITGDARIVVSTSTTGSLWTVPRPITTEGLGHQLMPALTFHAGKLRLLYYDLREDVSQLFGPYVDELPVLVGPVPRIRHTMDVFVAQALPGAAPAFSSTRLSDYAFGYTPGATESIRLQFNPPNLPLFRMGTTPFMGDYIDLAPSPAFVQDANGVWIHNIALSPNAMGHAFWTDNRDVRAPADGDWTNYTPVTSPAVGVQSRFDPTQTVQPCVAGQDGMRNQNIYTARVSEGLFVTAPGNNKTLGSIQRAFVVIAENATGAIRSYRLSIETPPAGTLASFLQFEPLDDLDVTVPPFSSVARTVFVTSTIETARVVVSLAEIAAPGGGLVPNGLSGSVVLNPDPSSPRIQNPRIQNPRIQNPLIVEAEAYNPGITNAVIAAPRIQNPRIQNPSILNPRIQNPRIQNDGVQTPRIQNDAVANPGILTAGTENTGVENAGIANPRIQNPRIQNVDLTNAGFSDSSWEITNDGNTTAAYTVNLVLNGTVPAGFATQLLIHKTLYTPAALNCQLAEQPHTILLANIPDPEFVAPSDVANPRIQNPRIQNPTLALAPGETASITLRVVDPDRFDGVTFDAAAAITPAAVAQSVNTVDVANNITTPRVALPLTITTADLAAAAPGTPYTRTLTAFGTTGPVTWTLQDGALPPGMSLSPDGTISGTPTAPGNYVFTVRSTDAAGNVDDQRLFIQVDPTAPEGFDALWNGQDTDWSNPLNWSPRGVPQPDDRVYISAAVSTFPSLTRDVTIRDLVVESGATLNTNGFTLTITRNVDAGQTIIGNGRTVVTGDGAMVAGVFSELAVLGRAILAGPVTTTGRLVLAPGSQLYLNGRSLTVGGVLRTDVTEGPLPLISGPSTGLLTGGLDVNGLLVRNASLRSEGGALTRFDNVSFDSFPPAATQLTISHPGRPDAFDMHGVSFFSSADPGDYILAIDSADDAQSLVINIQNALPADGSAATSVVGGADVNWIFDPDNLNLAIVQGVAPNPALVGSRLTYTIVVSNGSAFPVSGVRMIPGVPAGAQGVQTAPGQGSCSTNAGGWFCDLGTLAAGGVVVSTVSFVWPTEGLLVTTASVFAEGDAVDVAPANNVHTVVATVIGAASAVNLSLVKTASTESAAVGVPFNYQLTVTNAGTTLATNVVVTDILPAGTSIGTVTTSQGSCLLATTHALCSLGSIEPGQSATITIPVTPSAPGVLANIAGVASDGFEMSPENNIAIVTTLVGADVACSATFSGPTRHAVVDDTFVPFITAIDMNHDGRPDFVSSHEQDEDGGIAVTLNNGAGGFNAAIVRVLSGRAVAHAVGDFNGDTHNDVVVGVGNNMLQLLLGDGAGNLAAATTIATGTGGTGAVPFGDIDHDGDLDLLTRSPEGHLQLLANNGDGTFAPPVTIFTGPVGTSAVMGDLNSDGRRDLVIGLNPSGLAILLTQPGGGFAAPVTLETTSLARVRELVDLNSDGALDLPYTEGSSESGTAALQVLFGDGNGGLAGNGGLPTPLTVDSNSMVTAIVTADVNGDGLRDLIATHAPHNAVAVYLHSGEGWPEPVFYTVPSSSNPVVADFNQDGRPDIAVAAGDGAIRVLLNGCSQPVADLALTMTESADPVAEGSEVVYTMTVVNNGPSMATGFALTAMLSTDVTNDSLRLDVTGTSTTLDGATLTNTENILFEWRAPAMASGGSATFEIRVRPHGGGFVRLTASATSSNNDPVPGNNSHSEHTTVSSTGRIILVTTTADTGPGSLRDAIELSNADANDVDRIHFAIPGAGVQTIRPATALPSLEQAAILDARTQPGYAGTPLIELDGSLTNTGPATSPNALVLLAGNSQVFGFAINRFGGTAIDAFGPGNTIQGNFIGTNAAGTAPLANGRQGITLSRNNLVGGTLPAHRNIIGGNSNGIVIDGSIPGGAGLNTIVGNYIGVDVTGTVAIPNGNGVFIGLGAANNIVGGTEAGAGNVISGNSQNGVSIQSGAIGNTLLGNLIGTDRTGTLDVGNGQNGVFINSQGNVVGGSAPGSRNVISGNTRGIQVNGDGLNAGIFGNYIGLRADGAAALPNSADGVRVHASGVNVGTLGPGGGNVISGNGFTGVRIEPAGAFTPVGVRVENNIIGLNFSGDAAIGNGTHGVIVLNSPQHVIGSNGGGRNVISGNNQSGVVLQGAAATAITVAANYIGTDATGTIAIPNLAIQGGIFVNSAPANFIGGQNAGNVVSGNTNHGITVVGAGSTGNLIQGNLVGLAANGLTGLGNGGIGIDIVSAGATTVGGNSSLLRNFIAGNSGPGIQVRTGPTGISIVLNYIGANTSGVVVGNGGPGIFIQDASDIAVGVGAPNLIVGNGTGISVVGNSVRNNLATNEIHGNAGLAIDLNNDGPTANDAGDEDAGPNNLLNFPVLGFSDLPGEVLVSFNSVPNQAYSIHYYLANEGCTPLTRGNPVAFLGATSFVMGASGNASLSFPTSVGPITAVAVDASGNTSEFSTCITPNAAMADLSITKIDSADPATVGVPFTYTLTVTNSGPSAATNVVIGDTLPELLTATAVTTTRGSCSIAGSFVTCLAGTLGPAEQAVVTITVTASGAGVVTNQAIVLAAEQDPVPANNSATELTMIALTAGCSAATFSGPTVYAASAGASSLVFLADMNHDGAPDIVTGHHVAGASGAAVLLNDGTGAFGPRLPATSTNATVLPSAVKDFNGDTHLDVLLLEFIEQGNRLRLLLGNGTGTLTPQPVFAVISPTAFFATAADVDGDGDQDVLTRGTAGDLVVLRNNGAGLFGAPVSVLPSTSSEDNPVVADFNGDNRPDIAVAGPGAAFTVLLANGAGGYGAPVTFSTASVPRIRGVGDIDGDGFLDIAITAGNSFQSTARLILRFGDGAGAFGPDVDALAGNTVSWAALSDVNGDGHTDLVTTHVPLNTVAVQLGNGSGGFSVPAHFSAPSFSNPAVADLNDDGRPDIVVGDVSGTMRVLLNACGQPPIDLGLALVESADPVADGEQLIYSVTLTNHSDTPAASVTLTTIISNATSATLSNVSVEATSSGGGTLTSSGGVFTWTLPSVAAQDDVTFEFRVTSHAARNLSFASTATSSGQDTNASNNTVFETTVVTASGANLVVTNTNDSGQGSLRQAILHSNADSGDVDRIVFNIPGTGPHTISPVTALPAITQPVVIDGTTQPGFAGSPIIELRGSTTPGAVGLQINAGSSTVRGLVVNGFTNGIGMSVAGGGGSTIVGNYIGTNVAGTAALANQFGIVITSSNNTIGGTSAALRNIISGNLVGVRLSVGTGNTIQGNYVGLNATGTAAVGNSGGGLDIFGGAQGNLIGGTSPGAGNVISGSGTNVVFVNAPNNIVRGNLIGLDPSGTTIMGSNLIGISLQAADDNTIGGTSTAARNVISGHTAFGIEIGNSSRTVVEGNFIGTDISGTLGRGNSIAIQFHASAPDSNRIGGTAAGAGNTIAFNSNGIRVLAGVSNSFLGNSIHSNTLLGIDLSGDGVTANDAGDADAGVNLRQNFPILTSAATGAGMTTVQGTLNSASNMTFRVEFFTNVACDPSGNGEGQVYAGFVVVTTNASGNATFNTTVPGSGIFTATATDTAGNTSEFSPCITPTAGPTTFTVTNTNDSGPGSLRQAILDANARIDTLDTIAFSLLGTAPFTIAPLSELPAITDSVIIDGHTQPGSNGQPVVELRGLNAGATARGLWIFSTGTTVRGLTINNFSTGIYLDSGGNNTIVGNHIGTDWTGSIARSNIVGILVQGSSGNVIGGLSGTPATRNVISGNRNVGIDLAGTANLVQGNYIGLNAGGTAAVVAPDSNPNGIVVRAANNTIGGTTAAARNVISGFSVGSGIFITLVASNNTVSGNYIGTTADGLSNVSNSNGVLVVGTSNRIGDAVAGGGNLISGNTTGIRITSNNVPGNTVVNNVIGLNPSGATLGNSVAIETSGPSTLIGGTTAFTRNFIAGNGIGTRVVSGAEFTRIEGNSFGFSPAGEVRTNGTAIDLNAVNSVTIGGLAAGAGNIIANSTNSGVQMLNGLNNAVRRNSIHSNGGLGIDLTPLVGVTPNDPLDADTGTNNYQNFPTLTSVVVEGSTTTVTGSLQSTPNSTFVVDFFTNASCDASGNGEGQTWWGSSNVVTDGSGNAPISLNVPVALAPGTRLTATALDVTGGAQNSSEFSNCIGVALGTASPIGLAGFSGSETVETYSPNFGRQNSPVTFNGITYTVPSGQVWSDIPWANNGFWSNFPGASGTTGLNDVVGRTQMTIDFSVPVNRVGILAATSLITTFTMTAYDDNLVPMGAVTGTMPQDARAVFLGLQGTANIRRIVITEPTDNGQISAFDDLRFEFVGEEAPEPQPAVLGFDTSALMPLALVVSGLAVRLKQRRDDRLSE